MADYDAGMALKVNNSDGDLTDKLSRTLQVKSAMDAANTNRSAYPQTQGAFQQGQGAFGDPSPTEGWTLGKALNDFIGSKPAY